MHCDAKTVKYEENEEFEEFDGKDYEKTMNLYWRQEKT